jgi:diaminopimelate epimerase
MGAVISFLKMHGLGNDFVVVDGGVDLDPALIAGLCDRRFGVGADGVLRVTAPGGQVRMEYWNADGSEAEMCGNGLRCVARFALERGLTQAVEFVVLTPVGERRVSVADSGSVLVELGEVSFGPVVEIEGLEFHTASLGNPHAVVFVAEPAAADVAGLGRRVGTDRSRFPQGTNVEFVRVVGPQRLEMRVWERGIGETLACGSGIVAAAAVAHQTEMVTVSSGQLTVQVPGGEATVRFDGVAWWLEGPATFVFEGTWLDPVNEPF